ncbi:hypothetical protein [Pseudomonas frederiksbergensis]|uniref:Uncharacterized protein n=1 Tax=Pseudomonas frederiksbergensis TaxID=104087 RepID=A0A423KQ93_9PSED|nr:hypothetical protein [Pseudomonas frederiksbergensis]RON57272.1 hypothetical protein BK665_03990 [Pseudomonas frederiksbergensis]
MSILDPVFAIVATAEYLLLVDLSSKRVIPLESERPEYYGVSWFPGGNELVLSHSGIDNNKLMDIHSYANSELGWLSHGQYRSDSFLSAPHQIICASDGRVVSTNTGRNAITALDLNKPGHFQEKKLSEARWDRLSVQEIKGDHLNSLFEKDGHLYVVAHGHHNGSLLAVLTYPELELVSLEPIEGRTGLHNIWVSDEGQKIACHSNIGALIDVDSNRIVWEAGSPIFTRGLAVTTDFMVVGESQMTGRNLRRSSMSGLWILERDSYKPLDYFCLGPYGAVNEVRLLNVSDLAHHGHIFPFVSELIEDSLFDRKSEERLTTCQRLINAQSDWADMELIYGGPKQLADGGKEAQPDTLCLIKQLKGSDQTEKCLEFSYTLDSTSSDAHVGVVTYQGSGGDTDMHALLIKPFNAIEAGLVFWTNNGVEWAQDPSVNIPGLPYSGVIRVVADERSLEFYVDSKLVLSLSAERLPFLKGALGVRWIGSTIRRIAKDVEAVQV